VIGRSKSWTAAAPTAAATNITKRYAIDRLDASLLDRLPDVDLIVGTQKFHRVADYLENLRAASEAAVAPPPAPPRAIPPRCA